MYSEEKPDYLCWGVLSKCQDGMHIIMVDFDHLKDRLELAQVVQKMQHDKRHGDYFLVGGKKPGHYHIYCPTKVTRKEYVAALRTFEKIGADKNLKIPLFKWKRKATVLRFAGKDELNLEHTFPSSHHNERQMSFAHLLYLQRVFHIPQLRYRNHDNLTGLRIDRYLTSKP